MIPQHELDNLRFAIEDADEAGGSGDVGDGYDLLTGGLYRAQQLVQEGHSWAEDLAERWRRAIAAYNQMFDRRQSLRSGNLGPPPNPDASSTRPGDPEVGSGSAP